MPNTRISSEGPFLLLETVSVVAVTKKERKEMKKKRKTSKRTMMKLSLDRNGSSKKCF